MENFDKDREGGLESESAYEAFEDTALEKAPEKEDCSEPDGSQPENAPENSELTVTGAIETESVEENSGAENDFFTHCGGGDKPVEGSRADVDGEGAVFEDTAAKKLIPIWRWVGIAVILFAVAFAGATLGVSYICKSAIFKESDFFDAFIAKWAGVTENRVEVDYVSGEYSEDTIALAEKTLSCTVMVRVGETNPKGTFVQSKSGSGVIYAHPENTDIYYIVTNHHVVYGSKELVVEIRDESAAEIKDNRFKAKIKYLDDASDLAVLEIESEKELTVATQADSSKAKAGQKVIAAGNPLGHGFAVSFGYISNPYRVTTANNNVPVIVLDISVNPGNSGGGLFDYAGNLLGIVSSKATSEKDNIDGIAYAITVNAVNSVVNDLLTCGYVRDGAALDIEVVGIFNSEKHHEYSQGELNGYLFEARDIYYGVYVTASNNSLLNKGDLILSIDGKDVATLADLQKVIFAKKEGGIVSVEVQRIVNGEGQGAPTYTTYTFDIVLVGKTYSDPAADQEKNYV